MLVEATSDWIWETDADGRYTYCSPKAEDLLGYHHDELVGKTPFDLMEPEEAARVGGLFKEIVAKRQPFSGLLNTILHRDGRRVVLETGGVPVLDGAGRLLGYRGIDRDVTRRMEAEEEHRQLEEQLRHVHKMEAVGQLAGGVAHDFNNLLHAIQGHTDLALLDLDTNAVAASESLHEVQRAAERAAALVRQLLTFSRRESLQPKFIDLNDTVADLMKMLRRVIGEHIELVVCSKECLPTICADPGQIEQILVNTCVNARDAMPSGGRLLIETDLVTLDAAACRGNPLAGPGEHVLLRVQDTGSGIPAGVLERIFEPFFTTKVVGEGTGLGLATVYAIVERHAGVINVKSEEGSGTVFSIFLPVAEGPELVEDPDASPGDVSGRGETILLAEDDRLVRGLAINVLERAGYHVVAARDGEEALDLFKEHREKIALCLLDVVMPRRSGYDLYRDFVAMQPALPVIFSSGYAFQGNGAAPEGPNVRQIQKPYPPQMLLVAVREVLDR